MTSMIQAFLVEKAFEFTRDFLTDPENVQKWRSSFKERVQDFVEDSDTPWDDEAADALFHFLGW